MEATIAITADGFCAARHAQRRTLRRGARHNQNIGIRRGSGGFQHRRSRRSSAFLIHDGPREGDMARVIYGRFFRYAVELERLQIAGRCEFQYLITTTTPPPKDMLQGSRWMLDPVLDSRHWDKRLLKEDF